MYQLPITIELETGTFNIRCKGNYLMVLDCFDALNDISLDKEERIIASLMIFYEGIDSVTDITLLGDIEKAYKAMVKFFNCNQETIGMKANHKLIDWKRDEQLIVSAINNVSGKEIRNEEYIHWWTFMGYYLAIGECPLSTIVSIRNKIVKGKKLEKYEREFKNENPQYFKVDYRQNTEKELENWFMNEVWNK